MSSMLARHKGIDGLLTRAIESGQVGQVIEIAAGLSGRGIRMMQKYGDRLTYFEFGSTAIHEIRDLPETREIGGLPGGERVRALEAWC